MQAVTSFLIISTSTDKFFVAVKVTPRYLNELDHEIKCIYIYIYIHIIYIYTYIYIYIYIKYIYIYIYTQINILLFDVYSPHNVLTSLGAIYMIFYLYINQCIC